MCGDWTIGTNRENAGALWEEEAEAYGRLLSSSGLGPAARGSGDRWGVCRLGSAVWAVTVDGADPVRPGAGGNPRQSADRLPDPVDPDAVGVAAARATTCCRRT